MAHLVLAVGLSHGPTVQTNPDKWALLGERDGADPRLNYQELLRTAPPGLARELGREVQQARHQAIRMALRKTAEVIAAAHLDLVVVVSNLHRLGASDPHPVFGILRAPSFPVALLSAGLFDAKAGHFRGTPAAQEIVSERSGQPALATYLVETLIEDGFDIACTDQLPDGVALDDAFSFPDTLLPAGPRIPMVPFLLSRDLPNQATAARCADLGAALRRRIDAWPEDKRVGLIASGGLSHQLVDEQLDREVVAALVAGDLASLRGLERARLNRAPGTPEILNWVTVAAAMAPSRMQLIDYLACYRSLAGTGHGLAFGYWL